MRVGWFAITVEIGMSLLTTGAHGVAFRAWVELTGAGAVLRLVGEVTYRELLSSSGTGTRQRGAAH